MGGPTVVIADDHALTRVALRAVLEATGFRVLTEAPDAEGAIDACVREQPDVCLLDVRMPGGGINAAIVLAEVAPETLVVMVTVSREDEDLFGALRAGAVGYVLKDSGAESVPNAVRAVLRGEAALPRSLSSRILSQFRAERSRRLRLPGGASARLTPRETEILERLREGASTKEIAAALEVAEVTVRRHISSLRAKLGSPDRASAVELVRRAELEDLAR